MPIEYRVKFTETYTTERERNKSDSWDRGSYSVDVVLRGLYASPVEGKNVTRVVVL